jgi:spermidine synthase
LTNRTPILFLNVLIIAACGLIYELLAGTIASYVLGDSVTQFSFVIGLYLSALGVGAWLSRFLDRDLAARFVDVELAVALIGGLSAPLLFLGYARLSWFSLFLYLVVFTIGVLVGLELPILMRILNEQLEFKELVSRVLSFDYIGSLVAAVLFPMFLVPRLGLVRTSIVFGLLNAAVGLYGTWLMRPLIKNVLLLRVRAALVIVLLLVGFAQANFLTSMAEEELFVDEIVFSANTKYQRIVVTRGRAGFQLFLNGNLQFSSADEYRYHEALVHPAFAAAAHAPRRVAILGGGDGLALREVLKHPGVESVTLIDLDPKMTGLAHAFPPLGELNRHAFSDPRVTVINDDAMRWIEHDRTLFDAVIVDFPDPNSFALGKLYTTRFYRMLRARLAPGAAVTVQCTSPLFARKSYWCVIRTMEAAGFHVRPYQTTVPSFGVWGFALARVDPFPIPSRVDVPVRFLDVPTLNAMFVFSPDMGPLPVEINRLDNQMLVRYYEDEWRKWS